MLVACRIFNDWESSIECVIDCTLLITEKFSLLIDDYSGPKSIPIIVIAYPFIAVISCVHTICLCGPFACAGFSSWRISRINHGNRDGTDNILNLMIALKLFYALVIFQGIVFLVLFLNIMIGQNVMASRLLAQEQLPEEWGKEAISKYLYDISVKCRQDLPSIRGIDLIKYAVELLDSESQADYLYGERLLSAFIKKKMGKDVRSLLLPSRQKIQKLIESLRISSSLDETCVELIVLNQQNRWFAVNRPNIAVMSSTRLEIRELAAKIVADLAGHIDLAMYPESMPYISSLLQEETTLTYWNSKYVPYPQRRPIEPLTEEEQQRQDFEETPQRLIGPLTIREQRRQDNKERRKRRKMREKELEQQNLMVREEQRQWRLMQEQKRLIIRKGRRQQNMEGGASYELILQGLTILERLASNNDNCRLICSHPGLLAKITAPVYSGALIHDITIKAWSDIVTRSLKLLHKLIRAPGSTSRDLRHEISSNDHAMSNLKSILDLGTEAGQKLQVTAMEILTELALDLSINLNRETKEILITKQCEVFLGNLEGEESAAMVGRTLVSLSENNSDLIMAIREDIIDRLTELLDAKNNTHRTKAAQIMENMCAHCHVGEQHMKEILLPKVLKEVMSVKRESEQRKISADQNNSAAVDVENQRYSVSRKNEAWYNIFTPCGRRKSQENSSTAYQNKLSDQESKEQEAFLSLTLVIRNTLNSADDFDYAIENTIGREEFVDKLKSVINDNCEATPDSLRIVKLCGRIAESTMQCQQYQQYAEHLRNKEFESLLSEASETMSRLESCLLFHGTDFGLKNTVRPLICDIQLEHKS